jgi:tetratricopeptide (TPR) repeat protein
MPAETVDSLCERAREAIEQRNWERARQLYLQALGIRSDSPDVHHGLATVCFQLKDLPSAAYHFKEVTRLDPLRAVAYINLGAIYNLIDQLDDAILVLRRGIQLDAHRAEGYYNLGLVYRRKKTPDLAIQAYCEALRVNPRMADAHYNIANLYLDKQQYGLAYSHYKQALELRPNWDKAQHGRDQAEMGMELQSHEDTSKQATDGPHPSSVQAAAPLDPERQIDPAVHGVLLSTLHKAAVDTETYGRQFLEILETKIEPAIKELSSCLLYPEGPVSELDNCVEKFEAAMQSMINVQVSLHGSVERVRTHGEKLLKS